MERIKEIWERNENGDLVLVRTEVVPNLQEEINRRQQIISILQEEIAILQQQLQDNQNT
jgi:hypothetical protein